MSTKGLFLCVHENDRFLLIGNDEGQIKITRGQKKKR